MSARGATLIEVAVSLLLLTVGALALAGAIVHAQRERQRAFEEAAALAAAESWLEAWRAGAWTGAPAAGTGRVDWGTGVGTVAWWVTPVRSCLDHARVQVVPGRAGAWSSPPVELESRRFREGVAGCGP